MERLKQALEKAQQDRCEAPSQEPRHRARPRLIAVNSTPEPAEEPVVYQQTRTLPWDVERLTEHRALTEKTDPAIANAWKLLRTHVLQRLRVNDWNTLAITSTDQNNGKTLTAVNLAISLAMDVNQTVLLVDLDLRRPSVRQYFTDEPLSGISDYLDGEKSIAEILFNPGAERLTILPGRRSYVQSSEMLAAPAMVRLINELKTRYPDRYVLIDMPPVNTLDDVIAFSPHWDAVMLVVEEAKTTQDALRRAYDLLKERHILGTVLNKSRDPTANLGYY